MNKYSLFKEHKDAIIYGETPQDALMKAVTIPRQDKYIKDGRLYGDKLVADYQPQEDIMINSVLGKEDTSGTTRGDKEIHRMICDTSIGIIAIDMINTYTVITPV